ncbi:MAG: S41 family peptidase [Clostridiales bacterium]|nr:S41 family peptidase [Clostridiales bacterium]
MIRKFKISSFVRTSFFILLMLPVVFLSGCSAFLGGDLGIPDGPSIRALAVSQAISRAASAILEENQDDYATYFNQEEYKQQLSEYLGVYSGIGIYISLSKEDNLPIIISTMRGFPAFDAGLKAGDLILEVDGINTDGLGTDTVSDMIRGEVNTQVTLLIRRVEEGIEETFTITRKLIEKDSVEGHALHNNPDIAYFIIYQFTERSAQEFAGIYNELMAQGDIKGIIIDLRDNPGGSFNAALDIAGFFLAAGDITVWQKTTGGMINKKAEKQQIDLPLVCLQNGGSASASEVLLGALKDNGVAVTVGMKSFGKGITQTIYQLPSGAALRYTDSKYFSPSQYDLHKHGLEPDLEIELDPETTIEDLYSVDPERDNQLGRALKTLRELI